ncbi:hypothetical protein OF376_02115 [Ureaplasma miroungigenitalium]|uniref:Uncharacterized protein n=1 Tax=Ureaplasma miroungigenitalium TaxID=1042321 RepID=A0ABT3BMW0_9BACT|nr:hypothetical protein [Ureaplasma miroungigenitalium]MCV3728559.1 hypothetical protein [Ureaplasma miroungigenitalium]MCV3734434.1 hypothetical protein [Ureaplasma miroungigenitalium]
MHPQLQRSFPVGKTLYEGEVKEMLIKKYSDEKNSDINNKFKILDEREFVLANMAKYQNNEGLLCMSSYEFAIEKARFCTTKDTLKPQLVKIDIEDENFDMTMFDDELSVDSLRLVTLPEAHQNIDKIENLYPDAHNETKADNEMAWWLKGSLSTSCTTGCTDEAPEHSVSSQEQDVLKNLEEQETCKNTCKVQASENTDNLDTLINNYLTKETPIIDPRATILDERANLLENINKYQSTKPVVLEEKSLTQSLNKEEHLSNQFKNSEEIISVLQPQNIQTQEPVINILENEFKDSKKTAKTWYVFETSTRN